MARIPTVFQNVSEPTPQQSNVDQSQFQGDQSVQQATDSVQSSLNQYMLDEKKSFDLARVTQAKNMLDVQNAKIASDQENGWQNQLGQNAILFKDNDGNDFVTHYQNKLSTSINDVKSQLQLTPEQAKTFDNYANAQSTDLSQKLQQFQLKQGQDYKNSVFKSAIDVSAKQAVGGFGNLDEMDQNLQNMNLQYQNLGKANGMSNAEILSNIANANAQVHAQNMKLLYEQQNPQAGMSYIQKYGKNMTELEKQTYIQKFNELGQSQLTQTLINQMKYGMSNGSNTAFNSADPMTLMKNSQIAPQEFQSLKYNDPRLDSQLVLQARQQNMDWAIPIVTALRVAGEKSNNNQVSSANAKGVYQFTPIALQQVKNITGKDIDPTDPQQATQGALAFVNWISQKYNTKDPAVIASYYNGGGQFINQLKSGGADAIANTENRNYVKRIQNFDFSSYANNPVMSNTQQLPDISFLDAKNQAKVYAAREEMIKQQKQQKKDYADNLYEQASDMITQNRITSVDQLNTNGDIVKALDASQLKALNNQIDAQNGRASVELQNSILQNPSRLKGMPQSDFNSLLKQLPIDKQDTYSRMYADWNGRTLQDQKNADKSLQTNVTPDKVYDVIKRQAPDLGFVGSSGNKPTTNKNSNSAFYVAMTNDLYDRVSEYDNQYLATNGKRMTPLQVQAVTRSFMDASRSTQGKSFFGLINSSTPNIVRNYDPNISRSDVSDAIKTNMLQLAQRNPQDAKYTSISQMPDSTFYKYYFQFLRGKR
jgi:hypothetical protein